MPAATHEEDEKRISSRGAEGEMVNEELPMQVTQESSISQILERSERK